MTATDRAMCTEVEDRIGELESDNERLRLALISVWSFLRLEAGKDHKVFGLACGIDACILCLAEETAKQALQLPPETDENCNDGDTT